MNNNTSPPSRPPRRTRQGAFTLVELMIVIALVAVILALAAPSMKEMIEVRRLRAITAQLVTDFQFARSEAIRRRTVAWVQFKFSTTETCYTIFTGVDVTNPCDCTSGAGAACNGAIASAIAAGKPPPVEIRTVNVPKSTGTSLSVPTNQGHGVGFEPAMGSLVAMTTDINPPPIQAYVVNSQINSSKALEVILARTGRPSVCAPTGSTLGGSAC